MSASFDDLPLQRPGPPLNAWGLYGPDDELGRLNLITPEVIKRGLAEVRHGVVVNLNLSLAVKPVHDARKPLEHHIAHRGHCNDDVLTLNTQTSSQWDGFRHYPYQNYPEKGKYVYYGGQSTEDAKNPSVLRNGTHNYADHPITSRAHLLDIPAYLARHNEPPLAPLEESKIPLAILKACAKESNITLAPGDILVVHTGFVEAFLAKNSDEQDQLIAREVRGWIGVEASEEVLRWHWENGIAAVATDTVAYESHPLNPWPSIHQTFLGGWGLPIGELFDTRELAKACQKYNQYTFFLASMVLNVPGGIASPPNAQAIL